MYLMLKKQTSNWTSIGERNTKKNLKQLDWRSDE